MDGVEYSAIETVELKLFFNRDGHNEIDDLPLYLKGYTNWQYGQGAHSSDARKMFGSVQLLVKTENGTNVIIRHVVAEGSSQWVVGRNVTAVTNLIHVGRNAIEILNDSRTEYISLVTNK